MSTDFKVTFGSVGRSIVYEDGAGSLLFSFDFLMPDGKKMAIYKTKLTGKLKPVLSADESRMKLALERVKQFVTSRGFSL
ncbi:MAG: hypothetical protein WCS94_20465 [Verrucomicrobiota bacterium]